MDQMHKYGSNFFLSGGRRTKLPAEQKAAKIFWRSLIKAKV